MRKFFSIIVPVRDDSRIFALLDDLERVMEPDLGEVLVVLNGCSDDFFQLVNKEAQNKRFSLIRLANGNISTARNAGIKAASGEWVVFVDSDCRIEDDYVSQLICCITRTESPVVTGAVTFDVGKSYFSTNQARLKQKAYDPEAAHLFTPNLVVRKWLFAQVGDFDPRLSGVEDGEWSERAKACGVKPHFAPELRIVHGRDRSSGFIRKWIWYGYGSGVRLRLKCRGKDASDACQLILSHLMRCYRYRFSDKLRWIDVPFMGLTMFCEIALGLPVGFVSGSVREKMSPVGRRMIRIVNRLMERVSGSPRSETIVTELVGGDLEYDGR